MKNKSNPKDDNKKKRYKNLPSILLAVVGLLLLTYFCMINFVWKKPPPPPIPASSLNESSVPVISSSEEQSSTIPEEETIYPTDKLFITKGREEYKDGEMILRVPRLDLKSSVLDGAEPSVLDRGVGLYDYAQLPGKGNRNVSMTAHRNVEFQYINTITTGDMIYLEYKGIEYSYEYEKTIIVNNDDWSIVYCKDYPIVTLVSCHPINSSKQRMVVTAKLVSQKEIVLESLKPTSSKATSSKLTSTKPTSSKPTSSKATLAKPVSSKPTSSKTVLSIPSEPVPQSSAPAKAKTVVLTPCAAGTTETSNGGASIDSSNSSEGYVMVKYDGSAQKLKLQITGTNSVVYTYSLHLNAGYETFPLTSGNGSYTVNIYENVQGTQYALVHGQTLEVNISNSLKPYLYPNQYVNFNSSSKTVAKGESLALGAPNSIEVVQRIYNYVIKNIKYDSNKASTVKSGYLPVVDDVIASGKGICFDYAAVMATMLRTQNIPTRLEVGYASGNIYHAWISVYLTDKGWVNGVIQFDGTAWKLMDPTFASNANSSKSIMQFIGNSSNYTTKYVY